jgi:hypothetical protein
MLNISGAWYSAAYFARHAHFNIFVILLFCKSLLPRASHFPYYQRTGQVIILKAITLRHTVDAHYSAEPGYLLNIG